MRRIPGVLFAILVPVGLFGQTAGSRAEFEVASIRPAEPLTGASIARVGVHIDGAMVNCASLSLRDYLVAAYQVKFYQIFGPDWLAGDRFDVSAKLPAGAKRSEVPAMIQSLLEDRFEMKAHRDKKELPVYALTVGKGGPKLKESPLDEEAPDSPGGRGAINVNVVGGRGGTSLKFGRGASFTFADDKIVATKLSMQVFVDTLGRFLDRPAVDETGLTGTYDFELPFTPEDFRAMRIRAAIAAGVVLPPEALRAMEGASGDSLFTAVQAVGLKLESRKAPVDVVIVDSIRKTPTAN